MCPPKPKKRVASKRSAPTAKSSARTPVVLPAEDENDGEELAESEGDEADEASDEPEVMDIAAGEPDSASASLVLDDDAAVKAVSPSDPIRRYLEEIRRYPLLDPEEEIRLATRLHATGDLDAAKRLVQANLRLVVKIALEYRSIYTNLLDLIQEGNVGLMKAVSKYDPTKGARLGYYSSWWIRSYILKDLLDNFRLVRIGTTQSQKKLFYHLMREKQRLEAQGLLAGPKLLAEKLHVREKDVVEMQQRLSSSGAELPLDAPVDPGAEKRVSHLDLMADAHEGADVVLEREQMLNLLRDRLPELEKTLNERERMILKDRLLAEEPLTLQEVADRYGLTRERVRQIETQVIRKLRSLIVAEED